MTTREKPRARTTSLLGPLILLIVFRLLSSRESPEQAFLFAYTMLFLGSIAYAEIWSRNNPRQKHLLNIEDFTIQQGLRSLVFGIAATLALFLFVFLLVRPEFRGGTAGEKVGVFIDMVLIVATVEEFTFRWVLPRGMDLTGSERSQWAAVVFAQAAFAYAHPAVREAWSTGRFDSQSVGFFVYAFTVGLFLWFVIRMRASGMVPARWRPYFGFGTAVGIHGTLNTIFMVWRIEVAGIALGPWMIGASWIGVFCLLWVLSWSCSLACGRAASCRRSRPSRSATTRGTSRSTTSRAWASTRAASSSASRRCTSPGATRA